MDARGTDIDWWYAQAVRHPNGTSLFAIPKSVKERCQTLIVEVKSVWWVKRQTHQTLLTSTIKVRHLSLFDYTAQMDNNAYVQRILLPIKGLEKTTRMTSDHVALDSSWWPQGSQFDTVWSSPRGSEATAWKLLATSGAMHWCYALSGTRQEYDDDEWWTQCIIIFYGVTCKTMYKYIINN